MAQKTHDVQVQMVMDLSLLRSELSKVDGITDKAAKSATNKLLGQWNKLNKQIKATTPSAVRATKSFNAAAASYCAGQWKKRLLKWAIARLT